MNTRDEFDVVWDLLWNEPVADDELNPKIAAKAKVFRSVLVDAMKEKPQNVSHYKENRINLFQWLQDQFDEVLALGWQSWSPAIRCQSQEIGMIKPIEFGNEQNIQLIMELSKQEAEKIKVLIELYPAEKNTELAENLKLTVIDHSTGNKIETIREKNKPLVQKWRYNIGEKFDVLIQLNDMSVKERFII